MQDSVSLIQNAIYPSWGIGCDLRNYFLHQILDDECAFLLLNNRLDRLMRRLEALSESGSRMCTKVHGKQELGGTGTEFMASSRPAKDLCRALTGVTCTEAPSGAFRANSSPISSTLFDDQTRRRTTVVNNDLPDTFFTPRGYSVSR